jgi:hypothetical protein
LYTSAPRGNIKLLELVSRIDAEGLLVSKGKRMLKPLLVIYFTEPMRERKEGDTETINLMLVDLASEEGRANPEIPDPKERELPVQPGVAPPGHLSSIVPAEYVARFDREANAVYVKGEWKLVATQTLIELFYLEDGEVAQVVMFHPTKVKSLRIVYGERIEDLFETDELG